MDRVAPFAYGEAGGYLVATDANEVLICSDDSQATLWTHSSESPIVGVANTRDAILVLNDAGVLRRLDRPTGKYLEKIDCPAGSLGLTATASGQWAVTHAGGVLYGEASEVRGLLKITGATCAALDGNKRIAVGTQRSVEVFVPHRNEHRQQLLPDGVTGLAWSVAGWWLVSTPQAVFMFTPDLSNRTVLATFDEAILSGGVVSPTGQIVAFHVGTDCVALMGRGQGQLGLVSYPERTVGEIAFGPHPYLGIGIGQGDGNRLSLIEPVVERTDPPPDRTRNRWMIMPGIDYAKVAAELRNSAMPAPSSEADSTGEKKGCFGVLVLTIIAAATATAAWWAG